MPKPGFFLLHDAVVPDLPAGAYTLRVEHRIDVPGEPDDPIPRRDAHLEITGPRYLLPPDQILSTFPPNQARGAFSSRLPQVVLRRRTLPWERRHPGQPDTVPWLALVLLADGEGELRPNVPVAQCVSDGVALSGPRDAEAGTALRVTERVVQSVFPGRDEVSLLAHVREVDLSDTELALGDDDGWMAVVVANRLPQPGVRYRACLVSLEGQLHFLPDGAAIPTAPAFTESHVYPELGHLLAGGDLQGALQLGAQAAAAAGQAANVRRSHVPAAARGRTAADAWSEAPAPAQAVMARSGLVQAQRLPALALGGADLQTFHPAEIIRTFPVLAHWTFTCSEAGDFQARMQALDVGLLGTLVPPARPPPGKAPQPPTRPPPEVLATGHLSLDAVTRAGEAERVWYRGPLAPRPGTRAVPDAAGRVPILHVSDQARRLGPDGREDVSLAAAFEIGRLLALAEPAAVAALLRWRRAGFTAGRAEALLEGDVRVADLLRDGLALLPIHVGRDILGRLGAEGARLIGPVLPVIDPGVAFLPAGDLATTIARGFGLAPGVPDAAAPELDRVDDLDVLVEAGIGGLTQVVAALDRDRVRTGSLADELFRGVKP